MKPSRKHLSAQGLLRVVCKQFKKIKPPRELAQRTNPIRLVDCLMSGIAVFSLKFPSLLKFDESKEEKPVKHNLRNLYHVERAPSDTYMRERCDEVEPREIRKVFKKILACVQRGKGLEGCEYLNKHYLLAGDGTQFFTSNAVHCKNCCVKHHGKCHIKFVLPILQALSTYKKNTYLLLKKPKQAWEMYYIADAKQKKEIAIDPVPGLQEILQDKARKEFLPIRLQYNPESSLNFSWTQHFYKFLGKLILA